MGLAADFYEWCIARLFAARPRTKPAKGIIAPRSAALGLVCQCGRGAAFLWGATFSARHMVHQRQ